MRKTLTLIPITLLFISTIIGCKKDDKDLDKKTPAVIKKKSVLDLISNGKSVQFILNNGYSPKEIYDNDTTYLDSLYGKIYQAGLIFYFKTDGTGLVAAPTDDRTNLEWGCAGTDITGANGSAVGTGKQNTIDILAGCTDASTAAKVCDNLTLGGYSDWFLPSIYSLIEMNKKLDNNGYGAFGSLYWSSTEISGSSVSTYNFITGRLINNAKYARLYSRAVREF